MRLFVIVGMPASGKNIGRPYAELNGVPYFATGDIVRAEVRRRGLEPNPENTAQVSNEMRGIDGMGVTRKALLAALETGKEIHLQPPSWSRAAAERNSHGLSLCGADQDTDLTDLHGSEEKI